MLSVQLKHMSRNYLGICYQILWPIIRFLHNCPKFLWISLRLELVFRNDPSGRRNSDTMLSSQYPRSPLVLPGMKLKNWFACFRITYTANPREIFLHSRNHTNDGGLNPNNEKFGIKYVDKGPISTVLQRRANARNFTFRCLFAVEIGPLSACFIPHFIFFSVRERAEFSKSYNLAGSGSGRNFPILPALGGRNRCLLSCDCYVATFYLFIYLFIKKCFSGNPFKWPLLLRK